MIRVLIVDDHAVVRRGLSELLTAAGDIDVVGALDDGAGAAAAVIELEPDIVLMDLSMPGMDGIAATREIVAARPEAKVVVLTSFSDSARILGALEAG
ncbi:MAG: two-component system, NarL family, response regulator LiaR, partial [Frankiaceae bacterium]|nr:two-component system, NarL family, response regulator LiaR [Frankiaceae bacterium]